MCAIDATETQVAPVATASRHRQTLSGTQITLLQARVREGVKTTRDIAAEVGCAERTVRKYAALQGVRAPTRLEALDRQLVDRNADLAERAYAALRRLRPDQWQRAGISTLSAMIERHDSLVARHLQAERDRQGPPPAYQPNPLLAFLLGLFGAHSLAAVRQAGQPLTLPALPGAATPVPGGWLGAVGAQAAPSEAVGTVP